MGYFPFFMDIAGKNGMIVGGGKVAARKVEKLLSFDPHLTVIAPENRRMVPNAGETAERKWSGAVGFGGAGI